MLITLPKKKRLICKQRICQEATDEKINICKLRNTNNKENSISNVFTVELKTICPNGNEFSCVLN